MNRNIHICRHPLLQDRLARLRDKNTRHEDFRRYLSDAGMYLGYEAMASLPLNPGMTETPIDKAATETIACGVVLAAVLRTGMAFMDGMSRLFPEAKMGHIGLKRDEKTLLPVKYMLSLPPSIKNSTVFILDPMLATGGSAAAAVRLVREQGAERITFISLIAARQGLEKLSAEYPDMPIYLAAIDERLNDHGYIIPGLGDAGDRAFF